MALFLFLLVSPRRAVTVAGLIPPAHRLLSPPVQVPLLYLGRVPVRVLTQLAPFLWTVINP